MFRPIQIMSGDLFVWHRTITGLRALADFLEANPGVPVARFGETYDVHVRTDDAQSRALVDALAALLGVPVRDDTADGGPHRCPPGRAATAAPPA
jgi:hypothetical protein